MDWLTEDLAKRAQRLADDIRKAEFAPPPEPELDPYTTWISVNSNQKPEYEGHHTVLEKKKDNQITVYKNWGRPAYTDISTTHWMYAT